MPESGASIPEEQLGGCRPPWPSGIDPNALAPGSYCGSAEILLRRRGGGIHYDPNRSNHPTPWGVNFDSQSTPNARFRGFLKALSSATRALLLTT